MEASEIERYFIRHDGGYLFARWGRPIVPVVFGVDDATLGVIKGAIEAVVDEVIAANPEQVEQFRAGKDKVLGFFVGQVMKATQGKANPGQVNQLLRDRLKS